MNCRTIVLGFSAAAVIALMHPTISLGDSTYVYAVQLSASLSAQPARITLSWPQDPYGALDYVVHRKGESADSWGTPLVTLPGSATTFQDANVEVGKAYEYQVTKRGQLGYKGYGYIYTGIGVPLEDDRGGLLLVIETNATAPLQAEIERLRLDLTGEGWTVKQLNVSSNDSPENVKSRIYSIWLNEQHTLRSLFLLGHVPIMHSGQVDWDTHGGRPMPSDAYYADISTYWPTNAASSPSYLPSDAELMVGRVDFFAMPGLRSTTRWPSETELLRNYLNKNHQWRHGKMAVPRRALMGNGRGDEWGGAPAASAYRVFNAFVGPGNTVEAGVAYESPAHERWVSRMAAEPYLWAYGCGGGQPDGCGAMGTQVAAGVPGYLYSSEVVERDAKAAFVMMFGSWFGQWDLPDNLLRSFLATRSYGLAAFMAGRPHWFLHHVGLGKPLGYSTRLSMNNYDMYRNQSNGFPRAVYIALMGDPTLRMEPVQGPSSLTAKLENAGVRLTWGAPPQSVDGFHIYRSTSANGPFTRLTSALVSGSAFLDSSPKGGPQTYMVRAVRLQENPSGSYYNASQGAFATLETGSAPLVVQASVTADGAGVELRWNTRAGVLYRVQSKSTESGEWTDTSEQLSGNGGAITWIDRQVNGTRSRFYRLKAL